MKDLFLLLGFSISLATTNSSLAVDSFKKDQCEYEGKAIKKVFLDCTSTSGQNLQAFLEDNTKVKVGVLDCSKRTPASATGKLTNGIRCAGSIYEPLKGAPCAQFSPCLGDDCQKVAHGWTLRRGYNDLAAVNGVARNSGLGCIHANKNALIYLRSCKGVPFVLKNTAFSKKPPGKTYVPDQAKKQARRNA